MYFRYVLNQTNISAASHCRWWSPKTPMAKQNGGKYEFIVEEKMSLPIDDVSSLLMFKIKVVMV